MPAINWGLLAQGDEDALHNVERLLTIEARPFLRIWNRLAPPDAFTNARPTQLPSPPPDASAADEEAAARAVEREQQAHKCQIWRSNTMNELQMLDQMILHSELTIESNHAERERYAQEKIAITEKQERVKEDIEQLRVDLQEAKETLAVRKTYDELTEKITNSKMLKPRDEQALAHAKLDEEIAELEQEVQTAKDTWNERRVQFFRIEDEAKEMLRMIKDEKEEAERKEGMMKDRDEEGDAEGSTTRGDVSHVGTPRPDGGMTPVHVSQTGDGSNTLKVPQDRLAPLSRDASVAPSLARSGVADDTEMRDSGENAEDAKADDSSGLEEGEDVEDGEEEEDGSERGEISEREMDES